MLDAGLHPEGWDNPDGGPDVDFRPLGAEHFADPRRRQNSQL